MNFPLTYADTWESVDTKHVADLCPGAHLISRRPGFIHHGIYVGAGRVIHYGGHLPLGQVGPVECVSICCFAGGGGVELVPELDARFSANEIVARARSRLGEDRYRLLSNNCEHFCEWCINGVARSDQVRGLLRNPWRLLDVIRGCMRPADSDRGAPALWFKTQEKSPCADVAREDGTTWLA